MSLSFRETHADADRVLVLLHGGSLGAWMWQEQMEALKSFHCLAVDLPGHGDSHLTPWKSLDETARLVCDLVREKRKGRTVYLVGLSLGGYVALHVRQQARELIERMMITGIQAQPLKKKWLVKLGVLAYMPFIHNEKLMSKTADMMRVPKLLMPEYIDGVKKMSRKTYQSIMSEAIKFQAPKDVEQVNQSILFLAGERENKVVLSSLGYFDQHYYHSTTRKVLNVGHVWNFENSHLFTNTVNEWMINEVLPDELI